MARLKNIKSLIINKLLELNMFESRESNDRQVRFERIATRLYIVSIIISLTMLGMYTFLNKNIHHKTILNPPESKYLELEKMYSNKLSCPCTSMSIPYSNFIQIEAFYHIICSSELISSRWINYLSAIDNHGDYHPRDYRLNAASHFLALRTFCQQIKETIDNARQLFYQTKLINVEIIPMELFQSQINRTIQTWKEDTINAFLRTIQIIRATTQGNQLMNGLLNTVTLVNLQTKETNLMLQTYSNCSCALSSSCRETMSIYEYKNSADSFIPIHSIQNFFVGCFLFESLLGSTLECFYNRSCMIELDQYMYRPLRSSFNFTPLQSDMNDSHSTIESIFNRLMVNSWSINISYSAYYQSCYPTACTFEYVSRNDLFFVISTIIGVFGGLSLIFKIILFIGLRVIKTRMPERFQFYLRSALKNLCSCQQENQLVDRLHFVLVVITLCILYILIAFIPQSEIIEIENPSLTVYEDLSTRYPDTLQCSCREISIKYQSFIQIRAHFHEICSSGFVSSAWISLLYGQGNLTFQYVPIDFLYSGFSQFQLLASFCQLSQETVNNTLEQFMNNYFINSQLLSRKLFKENIQTMVDEFEIAIPQILLSTLSLIRETTGANQLMNTISTSWMINPATEIVPGWGAGTLPFLYQECNCALSPKCVIPSRGMLAGCYPLEALFQSTFRCLYDQHCNNFTHLFPSMNISLHQSSRFDRNSTIESIINQLMVEQYVTNLSYENYFSQCNASTCVYFEIDRTNITDGITSLISLYGGLMIVCRVFAVIVAKLIWSRKVRVNPSLP